MIGSFRTILLTTNTAPSKSFTIDALDAMQPEIWSLEITMMSDLVEKLSAINAKRAAKPERIVSMSNYGAVADKAWEATMSGKLWLITEKSEKGNDKAQARKTKSRG